MNALRGQHSTGVMSLSEDFRWSWSKQAVSAAEYINEAAWSKRNTKTWCAVGHGRHATIGEVNTDNAHPFQQESIILVHNGTLRYTQSLPFANRKIEVDSELIAYNLSKVEPDKAHEVLSKVHGAYALVWFDERDKSVNMVRNHERPLHLGINSQENALYFMSDGYMLHAIAKRFARASNGPEKIWQIATHQILKYKKGNLVPEVTEVRPFARQSTYTRPTNTTGITRRSGATASTKKPTGVHASMLKDWYMVNPNQEYFFEPKGCINWGNNEGAIVGVMWHDEWETYLDVVLPNCTPTDKSPTQMLLEYEGPWSIIIEGVSHAAYTKEGNELTFMGKIKWFTWPRNRPVPQKETKVKEESTEDEDKVQGPHGKIDMAAFELLVQSGCSMCSRPVHPKDNVTWVGELANQPLCNDCIEWFIE